MGAPLIGVLALIGVLGGCARRPAPDALGGVSSGEASASASGARPEADPGAVPGAISDEGSGAGPAALPRVLFLTHSAGYVHDVVRRPAPQVPSTAEAALAAAAAGRLELVATQDCALLAPGALESFDAVVFYTTGELPLPEGGREALERWVAAGGGFAGVHSAADTLYAFAPYHTMLGGTFDGHPWHAEVEVRVEDPAHASTRHLAPRFAIADEIYQFHGAARDDVHVLLSLDPASVDVARGGRADGDYPLAWTRRHGRGRVFYTALGHRAEVWRDPRFLEHLLGGIRWAAGGARAGGG